MIPTNRGEMQPESIISELTYSTYRFNRDDGMSAEALGRLFPTTGAAMEERYRCEQVGGNGMKDVKFECYKRDREKGATAETLATVYVNHAALEKRYQVERGRK
jgi:hypothetical protein